MRNDSVQPAERTPGWSPAPAATHEEFTVLATLYRDARTTVLRGLRRDRGSVILKVLDPWRCRERDLERLRREYEIGASLDLDSVVRPYGLETYEGMPALVLEDCGGQPLERLAMPMPSERFLEFAARIAGAVADVHGQGIVHKDLKPANIVVDPATLNVKIADFGIASRLPREQQAARPPQLIEGSLPYMSPEQTGRMNRALDSRSDLYSLGVTFYQMLTGCLPFEALDPLEWVHCHVARPPVPPSQRVPGIPEALDRIVMRLLAKMAEDRYQTARGLENDLARCLEQWRGSGRIEPFVLGEQDIPVRLQIPQRLYGREEQVAALLRAFERVAETGAAELVLVSGYAGIGKTSAVRELEKPILGRRGLFAQSKFDQHERDIPYSTIARAFGELVLNLLAEGEERVAGWRERLQAALGANGQLVVEMIPQLELLVGKQPPVPELEPVEARNRFRMVVRRFIGAFAREEHPLTLFMDDLQWVDPASLVLLQDLMADAETRWLLMIGAYRDNEVPPAHPLALALVDARKAGARITEIVLGALSDEALTALVADALRVPPREAAPLAELIREKTAANPFFAIQFLTALYQDDLLKLDENTGRWRWDIGEIRVRRFTDNVAELMLQKLKRLPPPAQEALAQLACLGADIEGVTAGWILGRSEEQARMDLWTALCEGLIFRWGAAYRFAHDRVQEAAYSLVPEQSRPAAHLRAGRILLSHLSRDAIVEHVFQVVDQLNRGVGLIEDPSERDEVRRLNVLAGRRAKNAVAYVSARTYLTEAAALLPPDAWRARYEEAFDLEMERSECEYLAGNIEIAEDLSAQVLAKAGSDIDRARVHKLRIRMNEAAGRNREAMAAVRDALLPFGMIVPESDQEIQAAIEAQEREVETQLRGRAIADLAEAPTVSDPKIQAIMGLIAVSLSPAYMVQRQHFPLLAAMGVNVCLRHGNTAESSSVYNSYALVRAGAGDFQSAFQFSDMALRLLAKFDDPVTRGVLLFRHGFFINHWRNHIATSLAYLQQSCSASVSAGNVLYAGYACFGAVETSVEKGDPLDEILRVSREHDEFTKDTGNAATCDTVRVQQRFVACLKGWTREPGCFDDGALDGHQVAGFAVWRYHVLKQMVSFLFGRYDEALDSAEQAAEALRGVVALLLNATHHFYRALTLAALYPRADAARREAIRQELAEELRTHRGWEENCPENFENRHALLSAEVARIEGRELDAERRYEQAIRSARDNGFVQNEALAYELASRFYRARGYEEIADVYLSDARARYARWGADGKVKQLDALYPHLADRRPAAPTATIAARPEQLDLLSAVKASQIISGEIEIEKLLATLLQVVLEQGGARRGCLVLERDGALYIEAEASVEEKGVVTQVLPSLPVESSQVLPVSVVHYARLTRQPVILADVSAEPGKFASDGYFSRHRTRSVLCLPILRQAEFVGLLYLENRYVAGAFTPDRLTTLSLLASQSAISFENARLLLEERQARQRSAFLAEAGALLSESSLDYEETLARLGRLCVQWLADWCVLDLVEGHELRRVAGACRDPAKEPLLERLRRDHPARWDSPHPAARSLRAGEPLWIPTFTDELLRSMCADEDHLEVVRGLGTRSAVVLPLVARGETLGVLSLFSATLGRYGRAEFELVKEVARRAASDIDNARLYREVQRADHRKSEFIAVLSHELRNPLAPIRIGLQLVRRSPPDSPVASRAWEIVARQTEHMSRLLDDLLDITRISHGKIKLHRARIDLCDLVRSTSEDLRSLFERGALTLRVELPAGPLWIEADATRVAQVVGNLLHNAAKFTPEGGSVTVEVAASGGHAEIAVRDTGVGMDASEVERMFEPFAQAEQGLARTQGGLGLGLALAKGLVELHGGAIRARSEGMGRGCEFVVTLPLPAWQLPRTV